MSQLFLRFGRAAVAVGRLVVDYRQTLYSSQYPDTEAYEVSYCYYHFGSVRSSRSGKEWQLQSVCLSQS